MLIELKWTEDLVSIVGTLVCKRTGTQRWCDYTV